MRISSVDVWPVSIPFVKPFEVWRGVARTKDHVIVEVHTDEGISGIGEASPFLYYAPETQEDVVATVTNHLAPMVRGLDPFDIEKLNTLFDTVVDGHHFSKAAIEMALWDIMGKALGVPVYRLLGGRVRDAVEVIALLDNGPPQAMAAQAAERVEAGYRHLKVKIGFDPATDVEIGGRGGGRRGDIGVGAGGRRGELRPQDLAADRPPTRGTGRGTPLPADLPPPPPADGQAAGVDLDPVAGGREHRDTGRCDAGRRTRHRRPGQHQRWSSAAGSSRPSGWAAIAEGAGMDCLIGSMIEMGPGTACGAHVAVSTPNVTYASELVGPQLIADDVLVEPLEVRQGTIRLPDRPGLGIELDRQRLARYARRVV